MTRGEHKEGMMKNGKFITLEGGEGSGKSTCIKFISTWLESQGIQYVVTREPGGTPLAEEIRNLIFSFAYFFLISSCFFSSLLNILISFIFV